MNKVLLMFSIYILSVIVILLITTIYLNLILPIIKEKTFNIAKKNDTAKTFQDWVKEDFERPYSPFEVLYSDKIILIPVINIISLILKLINTKAVIEGSAIRIYESFEKEN